MGVEPLSATATRRAVFLDRDGVINHAVVVDGVPHPPASLEEFALLPEVPEALARLVAEGFALVVVTNQPDVARGTQARDRVEALNDRVRVTLPVLDVLTCFHDDADRCTCRKPMPGLLLEAARRWQLDLRASFMVGDRWSDVVAGQRAGCRTLLIDVPYNGRDRCSPDRCVGDITEAAEWIIASAERGVG